MQELPKNSSLFCAGRLYPQNKYHLNAKDLREFVAREDFFTLNQIATAVALKIFVAFTSTEASPWKH